MPAPMAYFSTGADRCLSTKARSVIVVATLESIHSSSRPVLDALHCISNHILMDLPVVCVLQAE